MRAKSGFMNCGNGISDLVYTAIKPFSI